MTASLTLSAFGQTVASTGSSTSTYGFGATSGYRTEGDAGLTLVGCRFYDAQVGRFLTRDTYLDQKPYAYCDGDPVNAVDPSGHDPRMDTVVCLLGEGALLAIILTAISPITVPIAIGIGIIAIVTGAAGCSTGNQWGNQYPDSPPADIPAPTQQQINHQRLLVKEYQASGGAIDF